MKTKVLVLLVILVAAVLFVVFGVRQEKSGHQAVVGLDAPELTVTDASGKALSLSELRGSVVFVNFWATWCAPCKEELPSVQGLYSRFKDDKGFRMVTVLYRDSYDNAVAYLKDNNFERPVWLDQREKGAKAYGVTGVPETYIVSKKGILKEKVIGPADWNSTQAISLISNLLRE